MADETRRAVTTTLVLVAACHFPAFAQQDQDLLEIDDKKVMEEVVVVAPRIIRETRTDPTGGLIVERDEALDITDLNLARTADLRELEQRIEEAATRICEQLEEQYPAGSPRTPVCIRRAVEDSMAQVEQAVSEAVTSDSE
ncbi:MAG: UrcA family protein [Chromatocurvus sp.]